MKKTRKKSKLKWDKLLKSLTDIFGACLGLLIFSPLFLILPVIIKIGSKGPVIHKRKVVGKGDTVFYAYKFRTMVDNADKILKDNKELNETFLLNFKLIKDPRITRVGYILRRYSLDEIPQLINVLRGQMSLIGPRMMTPAEHQRYGEWRDLILTVKPGLSGLWQVSGRQEVSFQERMELDVKYVKNYSFWKDVEILYMTFIAVFKAEGAF